VGTILGAVRRLRLEVLAYILLVAGTLGDHLSTVVALTRPYIFETNPLTVRLMARGLWLPLDLVLIAVGIAVPYLLMRLKGNSAFRGLLAYPLVLGAIRLGACVWNLSLIV